MICGRRPPDAVPLQRLWCESRERVAFAVTMFDDLERMIELGASLIVIAIVCYVAIERLWWRWRRGRYWTGSSVGNALQQLQQIARPPIEHQVAEKLKQRKDEDDSGDPNDPASFSRRLRESVDRRGAKAGSQQTNNELEGLSHVDD